MFQREDLAAFLELLRTDTSAREQLRSLLRDERLDRLTAAVEQLAEAQRRTEERVARVEEQLEALAAAQRRTEERVEQLAEAQRRTEERLADLAVWVGHLRGEALERRYRERAPAYFSQVAQRVRVVGSEELDRLLDEAVEGGRLGFDETEDVRRADLVLAGRAGPAGEPVYLIVETSATIEGRDVERAAQRAGSLSRAGVRAIPVAAGARITPEAETAAHRLGVWRVLDGR
ncbi:MAG TPA: hypothetical protein VNO79_17785, partial [Actinomycetota bacterium]|nr:hypothetical protein [Actinomycetota bacterium]